MALPAGSFLGTVAALRRHPVKSMQGEDIATCQLALGGVIGDRSYALVDAATGRVVSAKASRLFPHILDCRPHFVDEPSVPDFLPPLRLELGDGTSVRSDAPNCDAVLSAFFGRDVRLIRAASRTNDGFAPLYDTPYERRLGAPYLVAHGMPASWAAAGFQDILPLSLLTMGSLRTLADAAPESRFGARRFRMNVMVEGPHAGFAENDWVDEVLEFESGARIRVVMPDPRCILTTLAQGDLPKDPGVLRAVAQHNMVPAAGMGPLPCLGVYARVEAAGALKVGAEVRTAREP